MKITNKYNLPNAFVNLSEDVRKPVPLQYSATTILKPTRMVILERRHFDEIEIDVSDSIWLVFGTAVHKILEATNEKGFVEKAMEYNVDGTYKLTGRVDLYNTDTCSVEDYKTASTWKVIYEEFDDWKKQGLIYAWLLTKAGYYVSNLKFHALLKDWTARDKRLADSKNTFYPEHPIYTWHYQVKTSDLEDIEKFIMARFKELIASEKLDDNSLPLCTPEERWNSGDKFAVKKQGNVKATKVFNNEQDALAFANTNGMVVEKREGEDRRCQDYCMASKFCEHYKNVVAKKGTKEE
jgi:hypothetical protein